MSLILAAVSFFVEGFRLHALQQGNQLPLEGGGGLFHEENLGKT